MILHTGRPTMHRHLWNEDCVINMCILSHQCRVSDDAVNTAADFTALKKSAARAAMCILMFASYCTMHILECDFAVLEISTPETEIMY